MTILEDESLVNDATALVLYPGRRRGAPFRHRGTTRRRVSAPARHDEWMKSEEDTRVIAKHGRRHRADRQIA